MVDAWWRQRREIRDAMRERGVSVGRLAARVGVTEQHMWHVLAGRRDGSLGIWIRAAGELGLVWRLGEVSRDEVEMEAEE